MRLTLPLHVPLLCVTFASADTIREALVILCDPAKIATISSEDGVNSRVLKICYWLEVARRDGRDPSTEMREVMDAVGWGGTPKGELTADAMVQNRLIAERFGCLDEAGMANLRRGNAPTIRTNNSPGDELSVDQIIPLSLCHELDAALANFELIPMFRNLGKSNNIGKRQLEKAKKFHEAGLLSQEGLDAVLTRGGIK